MSVNEAPRQTEVSVKQSLEDVAASSGYDVDPLESLLSCRQADSGFVGGENIQAQPGAVAVRRTGKVRARYCSHFDSLALQRFIDHPDAFVDDPDATLLKTDRTSTVVLTSFDGRNIVLKRYNTRSLWHVFKRAIRRSRAANCWDAAVRFRELGIDTARPVAMVERRLGPFTGRAYYAAEFVEGELCSNYFSGHNSGRGLERTVDCLVDMFRVLVTHRMSHGDTKATNFIVRPDERVVALDLDAVRRHRSARSLRRGFGRDRDRFLRNFDDRPALRQLFAARLQAVGAGLA